MFDEIHIKYNEYLENFEDASDRACDYETQPISFTEFEDEYINWNERE
ncbi:MAG: hypothetical protein PHT02_00325 [Tissierellia bacterium]|nr:hypothetical protein [Tissierellia bacterium]